MGDRREIYCCGCETPVQAVLVDGREIYPHRRDLYELPFWKCPKCKNYVGCHHRTNDRTRPLGVIPTPGIRQARSKIHAIIDPLWRRKRVKRGALYASMAEHLGISEYHTAETKSLDECARALDAAKAIANELDAALKEGV